MKFLKIVKKPDFLFLGLLLLVSIPTLLPLLHPGFFVTDDGEWMIIRFSAFYQALADGQFPVRFLHRLNFDYGYPVATFLYPGFMYAGVFLHLLKIGFAETVKSIIALSLVGTAFFSYLWLAKVFTKKSAAFVGAVVSLYIPYHLYDVYTRGSVGEVFALLWVPFILWMIERKNVFFVSIGIGLLLISHNTIALLFLPLLFFYALFRKVFSQQLLLISFITGILLAAFFIIPAIFELSLTKFSQISISDPKNYFAKIDLIGISTLLIFVVAGGKFIFQKKSEEHYAPLMRLFVFVTFFAAFLSSERSAFLWQYIPSSFIQFPFRLLSYLVISLPFLAAFLIVQTNGLLKKIIFICVILLSFAASYQYISPKIYTDKTNDIFATNEATTTVKDEYLPLWVTEKPLERPQTKVVVINGQAQVTNVLYNNKLITFDLAVTEPARVRINTLYWPGWEVFVDNQRIAVSYNNPQGVMEFGIGEGNHTVRAQFHETLVRLISDAISMLTLFLLIGITLRARFKKE